MTQLGKAIALAAEVHIYHKDMGGNAYILHPIRVMQRLRTTDEELLCIAILHDVVEDSGGEVTLKQLATGEGFSPRVVAALTLLTHDKNEDYDVYIKRISTSRDAARVKLEDLRDNSDITRLKGLRPKDFERVEKYHRAFLFLSETLKTMERVGY